MAATQGSSIVPSFRYRDAYAAIDWLQRVLGFTPKAIFDGPDDTVAHAELTLGAGMIMLGSATNSSPYPQHLGHPSELGDCVTSPIYLIVPDCTPVYERVQEAGTEILQELRTMDYGGQSFTVRDPEGYVWSVGEYDPWAVSPAAEEGNE